MKKLLFALVLLLAPSVAVAEHQTPACGSYEIFKSYMIGQFGEELDSAKKAPDGGRYEIWRNSETGTWTVLRIMHDNQLACVIGTGAIDLHTPEELMQRNAFSA